MDGGTSGKEPSTEIPRSSVLYSASTGFKVTREKNGEFDLKLVIEKDPRHADKSHTYYSRMDGRSVVPGLSLSPDLEGCIGTAVR